MAILSDRALQGLKAYKYKPGGYTILDYLHNPFWNWLTERLPLWLAPNLITLTGFLIMFAAYAIIWAYLPDFTGDNPRWSYLFAGMSIILYTNLDCIDGKQARRTGSSSPLGQLFDHGCDAFSLHIMISFAQSAVQHRPDPLAATVVQAVNFPWLISHYEEYHTGVLMYGDGLFGILEANYCMAALLLGTGAVGPGVWRQPLAAYVPPHVQAWLPRRLQQLVTQPDMRMEHAFHTLVITLSLLQVVGQLVRIFRAKPLPQDEVGHKHIGAGARLQHLGLVALLLGCGWAWVAHDDGYPGQARLNSLVAGEMYAYFATQLIMDHMCKEPFRPPVWLMAALVLGAANALLFCVVPRHLVTYAWAPLMTLLYLRYLVGIVREVTVYLGITCFTIKRRQH